MIQPKRLLEGEGTELERILLASGRAARPNARAKWRTGIAFFLIGIGTVSKAHAVALLGAKLRAWTLAQWLAVSVTTGAAGWAVVHAKTDLPDPPVATANPSPPRSSHASRHESSRLASPAEAASPPVNVVDVPAPSESRTVQIPAFVARPKRSALPSVSSKPAESPAAERSIASEIEELDRAREALGTGEAKRAVDRLNRYDRAFPKGTLREEALRLRIEAVASTGDRATARTLAQRFQALYPDSTHAERLRALVKEP
jgi:hypothetical protein